MKESNFDYADSWSEDDVPLEVWINCETASEVRSLVNAVQKRAKITGEKYHVMSNKKGSKSGISVFSVEDLENLVPVRLMVVESEALRNNLEIYADEPRRPIYTGKFDDKGNAIMTSMTDEEYRDHMGRYVESERQRRQEEGEIDLVKLV